MKLQKFEIVIKKTNYYQINAMIATKSQYEICGSWSYDLKKST